MRDQAIFTSCNGFRSQLESRMPEDAEGTARSPQTRNGGQQEEVEAMQEEDVQQRVQVWGGL